jgi:hemerythrin-like domain-containing protein
MTVQHSDSDDVITELVKDHREVQQMFDRLLERQVPTEERASIVSDVITELVKHSVVEEQHLYPLARRALDDGDQIADHEIAEHAEAERLMKQLEQTDMMDASFEPTLHRLMTDIRHHIEEEERDLFPRLRQSCPAEELQELGDTVRSWKKVAPTHPHPSAPDTPPADKVMGPVAGLVDRVRDALSR